MSQTLIDNRHASYIAPLGGSRAISIMAGVIAVLCARTDTLDAPVLFAVATADMVALVLSCRCCAVVRSSWPQARTTSLNVPCWRYGGALARLQWPIVQP